MILSTSMAYIDTHCHLTNNALNKDLRAVWQRAGQAGVTWMITVGTDVRDFM